MGYRIREYLTENGKNPFRGWLFGLAAQTKARIQARLFRAEMGSLGEWKRFGHGLNELRLSFGSGYRIYFGFDGQDIIVLLVGGDKGTQRKDITRALEFWNDYGRRKDGKKKH